MTEEEKKAIEILDTFELRRKTKNYNKLDLNDVYASQIALNLISKLQADIEIKDKVIEKAFRYVKKKQSQQYKYALSKIECEELIKILKK